MLLPAVTIHSVVRATTPLFRARRMAAALPRAGRFGPTLAGLAMVPLLPYMCDARGAVRVY